MFQNLKHRTERDEEFKDMDLKSSKRGFHRSPGTNSSVVKGNETRLVRCVHCGFPCDRERDVRAAEDSWAFLGINLGTALSAGTSIGDARTPAAGNVSKHVDTYYNQVTLGGCPCCGSFLYDKKPMETHED